MEIQLTKGTMMGPLAKSTVNVMEREGLVYMAV